MRTDEATRRREALWKADGTCVELPPPDTADVEAVLRRRLVRLAKTLAALEEASGEAEDEDEVALRVEQARAALLRRLVALVPRKGLHLTRYHGVFAPNAALRGAVVLPSVQEEASDVVEPRGAESAPGAAGGGRPQARGPRATATAEPTSVSRPWGSEEGRPDSVRRRRPRLDWATLQRRTFGEDVFRCPCGGTRVVLALVTRRGTAREVLRNRGLLEPDEGWGACATGPAQRPALGRSTPARRQLVLVLELDGAPA